MTVKHILVVDDEEDIVELIRYNLVKNGYKVSAALRGEDALLLARKDRPDLIILDLMLPGIDGLEVCRILRNDQQTRPIPIVMLTARSEEADIVTGLEFGADDYITKPFSPRVLLARVKAVLRRKGQEADQKDALVRVHDIVIDPGRHQVRINDKSVELTHTEFQLLLLMARRPGRAFSRDQIIDAVHGEDYAVTDRSVDVLIVGLRKKLGPEGKTIETVRGVGYRLRE